MRYVVVAVANIRLRIGAVAALMADDKGGDAGGVRLDARAITSYIESHMLRKVIVERPGGNRARSWGRRAATCSAGGDLALQIAHPGKILVQLAVVRRAQSLLQFLASSSTKSITLWLCCSRLGARFRGQAGVPEPNNFRMPAADPLGIIRHGFGFPGNVKLVDAAISRVARAGARPAIAAQFQRRHPRLLADLFRRDLVHGDAQLHVRAFGFERVATGEIGGGRARMVRRAVGISLRLAHEPGR